ncbi:MAG: ABC-F family ATP-binding cassette domain-containing protein [Ignavibacteria bacterium]|nr:ABC-F family ATP-binding cassette domain-containing protein [Ignavibacteria bacterium]
MIALVNVSKQYGGDYLFRDISIRFGDRERVAIVGSNGAGKSTLMKIVVGLVEPDAGEIAKSRHNTVGYLPQDGVHHAGRTLFEEASTAFDDIMALHDRVDEISREINLLSDDGHTDSPELHALVDELGEMQHQLEHREGYNIQTKVTQVLSGLGFREKDIHRMTDEFSGGWQMRIALVKLLLQEPTILLLDEPTNHLDLEALEWLENYLRTYEGSIVMVSHDRRFLDNIVTRTLEISLGRLSEYSGNYSYYVEEKVKRVELLQAQYENQQQMIKQTEQFVERFRYKATKARQVQSRLKMLEKIERVEIEDEEKGISFDFPVPPSPGKVLMELKHLAKSYGALEVFDNLNFTVERGDRIAFLGVNGVGKSTLARIIAGIEPYQHGTRAPGHNVIIGYYAQNQAEELDPKKNVLETVDDIATGEVRKRLRTLLGCFLFSGDDVFKQVSVLSGGEKSRLALAKMLLTPANLLVLDEPTNHLDMRSKAVLQDALSRFEGSFIIVSHDRDFLDPLINKCVDFPGGVLRATTGSVTDYLRRRHSEMEQTQTAQRDTAGQAVEKKSALHLEKERKREEAALRQERYKKSKPVRNAIAGVEKKIAAAEKKKADLEAALGTEDTYHDAEHAKAVSAAYKTITSDLAYLYDQWAKLQEEMEGIEMG